MDNPQKKNQRNENKKALIIAVSDYDDLPPQKQLPFCKNDGEVIYDILTKQGYQISSSNKLVGRVTGQQIRKCMIDFFRRDANSEDTLLFYFSGHGMPDGYGGHFLASSDININIPEENGYRFSDLEDITKKSNSIRIITILDCCFSGAAEAPGAKGNEQDIANDARAEIDKKFQGDGKCVLASSLGSQASFKMRDQDLSTFTYFIKNGLAGGNGDSVNRNGEVTIGTLNNYVYKEMLNYNKNQKPIANSKISGDIVLALHLEFAVNEKEWKRMSFEALQAKAPDLAKRHTGIWSLEELLSEEKVGEFNFKRTESNFGLFSIHGLNLEKRILEGIIVKNSIWENADFRFTFLANADFSNSKILNSKFNHAILIRTNICNSTILKSDLSDTDLKNSYLIETDCSNSSFSNSYMNYCILIGANLSGANLSGATLSNSILLGIQNYQNLNCKNSNFVGSLIDNPKFLTYLEQHGSKSLPRIIEKKEQLIQRISESELIQRISESELKDKAINIISNESLLQ